MPEAILYEKKQTHTGVAELRRKTLLVVDVKTANRSWRYGNLRDQILSGKRHTQSSETSQFKALKFAPNLFNGNSQRLELLISLLKILSILIFRRIFTYDVQNNVRYLFYY